MHGHLYRGSSLVRGEQIAEYLGAKYNPASGYENDVCIYVKPNIHVIKNFPNGFIDMIDDTKFISWLREHPKMSGIVASKYSYDYIKNEIPNKLVFIPQQHCNFERFIRDRKIINTVGIIGLPGNFQYSVDEMRDKLAQIGLQLLVKFDFETREDVVNFYKNIDIQIIWETQNRFFKNPLKIINAASFGIPTVGFPQNGYKEVEGYYIKAQTIDQLIEEIEKLKDEENYKTASKDLLSMTEKYHISKIAEMYKKLD